MKYLQVLICFLCGIYLAVAIGDNCELNPDLSTINDWINNSPSDCKKTMQAKIVFLLDLSTSISNCNINNMKLIIRTIVGRLSKTLKPEVAVVGYSNANDIRTFVNIKNVTDETSFALALDKIKPMGGMTATGAAMAYVRNGIFQKENPGASQNKKQKTVIILTDGFSSESESVMAEEQNYKSEEIETIWIAHDARNDKESAILIPQDLTACDIARTVNRVTMQICSHKTCINEKRDVIFLVDISLGAAVQGKLKEILTEYVNNAASSIGNEAFKIGVDFFANQWSQWLQLYWSTNTANLTTAMSRSIDIYGSLAGVALKNTYLISMSSLNGGRSDADKEIFFFSDGWYSSFDNAISEAEKLRENGVVIKAISIEDRPGFSRTRNLAKVTGDPSLVYVYSSRTLNVKSVVSSVMAVQKSKSCSANESLPTVCVQ
ncbi:collagen alpha-6(VI) chain-like isoform X2 [Tubulanus polymorphus]|uniref:collagen alpha-6(VI) chain-like isoform X2 n=1 Tax=Tubulanus polymorphus TaxID=672921 RepID=UPI003DA67116